MCNLTVNSSTSVPGMLQGVPRRTASLGQQYSLVVYTTD
jgi:hypothetical protein